MITDLLLGGLEAALVWLAGLFPATPDWGWLDSYTDAMGSLGAINYFLPVAELAVVFTGVLLIFPFFAGTSLLLWIIAQLRGSSARG